MEELNGMEQATIETMLHNISTNNVAPHKLEVALRDMAVELLGGTKLMVGDTAYAFKEVELYFWSNYYHLNDEHKHEDPYVHGKQYSVSRQLEFGEWYFHRFKSIDTYNHLRRGLDITFGNKENGNLGGILIRAIKKLDQDEPVVSGPSNVVGEIIGEMKAQQIDVNVIEKLAKGNHKSVFSAGSLLRIVPHSCGTVNCLATPRYGLSDKATDFKNREYRFIEVTDLYPFKDKYKTVQHLCARNRMTKEEANRLLGYNIKAE